MSNETADSTGLGLDAHDDMVVTGGSAPLSTYSPASTGAFKDGVREFLDPPARPDDKAPFSWLRRMIFGY